MKRVAALMIVLAGCGGDDEESCSPATGAGCPAELACETVSGSQAPRCVTPVVVRGAVVDSTTGGGVAEVRVLASGEDGAPLAPATLTGADGSYEIRIHVLRDSRDRPLTSKLRLSASANGFGSFPDAWREWPLLDAGGAVATPQGDKLVLATFQTNLSLVPFAGGPGRGVLTGHVDRPSGVAGQVLVVAETDDAARRGFSGWADSDGTYAIYGLPPSNYRVRAYAKGASYSVRPVGVNAGERTTLDLALESTPAVTVSGSVDGGGTAQVALVVASTWDPDISAGDAPVGLSAAVRDGGFTIGGVPAGRYVLVDRDADGWVPIGDAPVVDVNGANVTVSARLKLVPALAIVGPGAEAPQGVTAPPMLSWQDFNGETRYRVDVLNAAGVVILDRDEPAHNGDAPSIALGAALAKGMVYRFRARAFDAMGALLTRTEDRRGVFIMLQ